MGPLSLPHGRPGRQKRIEREKSRAEVICAWLFLQTDFCPPPPGSVPKRRLEIQQSQPVWELNNQQPYAGIRRDRTAIQTAGAASGGRGSALRRKKRFTRVPSRPTPVAMAAPCPAPPRPARGRHATPASHGPRRPPGVPLGFLVCGPGSAELVTSRKDESPVAKTWRRAGSGPRPARLRLCRRHVPGSSQSPAEPPSRGGAGEPRARDPGAHVPAAPASLPRPRLGSRVPAAPAPLPRRTGRFPERAVPP